MISKVRNLVSMEWGWHGAQTAARRGDLLVIVDVLSFSTSTIAAVAAGARIYPITQTDDAEALRVQIGGAGNSDVSIALRRDDIPAKGRFSLSPPTLARATPQDRIILASPNGATCVRMGKSAPALLVGALLNARAVAHRIAITHDTIGANITLLACGERFLSPTPDGTLRFAIEDYLGVGAILSYLPTTFARSAEALVCEKAFTSFLSLPNVLFATLRDSESGIELRNRGYPGDVTLASSLNTYETVPVLVEGSYFVN